MRWGVRRNTRPAHQVLVWAFDDQRYGVEPDTVSAIEVAVDAGQQGRGLSAVMLGTDVPGALAPVRCEPDRNWAVYVEPDVWIRHNLR